MGDQLFTMKTQASIILALAIASASVVSQAQEVAVPAAEPVALADPTVDETKALMSAINKYRTDLGLVPLAADPMLAARAAEAFPAALNGGGVMDVTKLRNDFDASDAAILRGVVTHRGAKSGAEFPKYWAKDPQWNVVLTKDFTSMGAATVKRSDGKLVAFVYLIKR